MFGVSVEILKGEAFKSLSVSETLHAGLCTVCAFLYFLGGEGKEPFLKRCLRGGQGLGMVQGMQEA